MNAGSRGYTLLEVLISLTIFGVLLVELGQSRDYGLRMRTVQARMVEADTDLDAVNRLLRALVTQMDPGSVETPPTMRGTRSAMAFTTELPGAIAGTTTRRADVALMVNPKHELVLRVVPHAHAVNIVPPANAATNVLLAGVATIRVSYYAMNESGAAGWTDAWTQDGLPLLVRIRIGFPSGDPRHWPDIVAEPVQSRPRA